jgi:ribose transport system ATP-binding protein
LGETAAGRRGARVDLIFARALLLSALAASIAAGGRGSFVGATLGALFLTELVIIVPFLGLDNSWSQILVGALTLLALIAYQTPDLVGRVRGAISDFRASMRNADSRLSHAVEED